MKSRVSIRTLSLAGTWHSLVEDLPLDSVPIGLNLQRELDKLGSLEVYLQIPPHLQCLGLNDALGEDSELPEEIMEVIHRQVLGTGSGDKGR